MIEVDRVYAAVRHHTSPSGSPLDLPSTSPPPFYSASSPYSPSDDPMRSFLSLKGPVIIDAHWDRATRYPN